MRPNSLRRATTLVTLIPLAVLLTASACGKGDATEPSAAGAAVEAAPAKPAAVTATIPGDDDDPEVKVTLELPAGWLQHDFFKDTWVPNAKADPMKVGIKFNRTCNGMCDAAQIPANIALARKEAIDNVVNPNFALFGLTEEDGAHLRGEAEVVEDVTLENGAVLHAYRATFPEAPAGKVRSIAGLFVSCYLHNAGDDHYIIVQGTADKAGEKHIWPAMKHACGSASYTVAAEPATE